MNMVTESDWQRFMQDGTEPDLAEFMLESWRLYRKSVSTIDSSRIARLSPEEVRERTGETHWFLERVDEMVTRSRLTFEGSVHFFDVDCYQLYARVFSRGKLDGLANELTGCRLAEDVVGNGVHNLAIRLRKPVRLSHFEHVAPLLHDYVGYAEPVQINGVLVGSFGVYVKKPVTVDEGLFLARTITRLLVEGCLPGKRSTRSLRSAHDGYTAKYEFRDIVHSSTTMAEIIKRAQLVSQSDYPVLIGGESGTGKEYLAQAIHNASPSKNGPFVPVNCAALTHSLAESELFGYADGAFTGAVKGGRKGKIEQADGGTLFLDEVGDLPLGAQAMLLRALQEREVARIGDEKLIAVDIRVICASNKDLRQLCVDKAFRWDLYYRLAAVTLVLPPLRNRIDDLMTIAEHVLDATNQSRGESKQFTPAALELLQQYAWPGNIRELRTVVETSHLLSQEAMIDRSTIADLLQIQDFVHETLEYVDAPGKKEQFIRALDRTQGKIAEAAAQAGIPRSTAYRWLKEIQSEK